MKRINASIQIFLFLCVIGIGMNAHAGECSSVTSDLNSAVEVCKKNKQFVLDAVRKDGSVLKYASPAMQDDEEIVEVAVKNSYIINSFEYASPRLKRDAKFILKLLKKNSPYYCNYILGSTDASLRNNKAFMLNVLELDNEFIKHAGDSLKKDKEIGLFVINHEIHPLGRAFAQLDISLRDDFDVARAALKRYGGTFNYVSDRLKQNRELALAAVKWEASMWKNVPQTLKDDVSFINEAVALNPKVRMLLDEKQQQDKTVVLAAIEKDGDALKLLQNESFQSDEEFFRSAIKKNGGALRFAPENFAQDKETILAAVRNSGMALAFASKPYQQDRDIVLAAVRQNGVALAYADKTLQKDPDIVFEATKSNPKALIYVDQSMAKATAKKLGIETGNEQVVGTIQPVFKEFIPHGFFFTADGKRIYVLKYGRISQYQISPFKLLSTFKVINDSIPRSIQTGAQRMFVTDDDSKIIIHDWKSIKLIDIKSRSVIKTVTHDSQNALLVDNVLVTFGPDNILTFWKDKTLQETKKVTPDFKWTGIKEYAHHDGPATRKYDISRGGESVLFMFGSRIVINIPAINASHGDIPGDILLIDKNTFRLETHIIHYDWTWPKFSSDQKSIVVSAVESVYQRNRDEKLKFGVARRDYKYDVRTGKIEAGNYIVANGGPLAGKTLYVYENGEAVLYKDKSNELEMTENARKYLWMNFPYGAVKLENLSTQDKAAILQKQAVIRNEFVPVNDATFEKYVISNGSRQE